tara:strand:+ start:337 stop:690 length:354 start_codon:yes stop_codon:yes gene_type:complete
LKFLIKYETHHKFIENTMKKKLPNSTIQNAIKYILIYDYLKNHVVKIIFYEMPISKSIENPEQIRLALIETFPPDQFEYVNEKKDFKVISKDGFHLTGSSISDYSSFFKDKALILAK